MTGFYTTEQLLEIFNKASIDVPSISPNATTLTYSGPLDTGYSWQIAEPIGAQSSGEIRTIGNTDVSKLLNDPNMKRALLKANNYDEEIVRNILDGEYATDQNGNKVRIKPGWTDIMSERSSWKLRVPLFPLPRMPIPPGYGASRNLMQLLEVRQSPSTVFQGRI